MSMRAAMASLKSRTRAAGWPLYSFRLARSPRRFRSEMKSTCRSKSRPKDRAAWLDAVRVHQERAQRRIRSEEPLGSTGRTTSLRVLIEPSRSAEQPHGDRHALEVHWAHVLVAVSRLKEGRARAHSPGPSALSPCSVLAPPLRDPPLHDVAGDVV